MSSPIIENKRTKKFEVGNRVIILKNDYDDYEPLFSQFEGMFGKIISVGYCTVKIALTGRAYGKNVDDSFWLNEVWAFYLSEIQHAD